MTSGPEATSHRATRRSYIDWARGLAVLIMIEAHVLDSWTLRSQRDSALYGYLNILGGMAAPLFLWLAGLSVVLAAEHRLVRSGAGSRSDVGRALIRRGAEIYALAFLFRLQAFVVSPGNPLVSLLRVDILNVMGPAMMVAALLWWIAPGTRGAAWLAGSCAAGVALVTPVVRTSPWLGTLPPVLQWYLSPSGNHSTFTLFPWAGFVFAGAAAGAVLAAGIRGNEGRVLLWLAAAGALIAAGCCYASARPSIYANSSFWTTSPTYFGIRAGGLMIVLAGLFALTPLTAGAALPLGVLARFGRHSLFVYWIHVELVYGYASLLVHQRLPLWGTAVAYVLFVAAMYRAIDLRDWVVTTWQDRHAPPITPETLRARRA